MTFTKLEIQGTPCVMMRRALIDEDLPSALVTIRGNLRDIVIYDQLICLISIFTLVLLILKKLLPKVLLVLLNILESSLRV